MTSNSPGGGGHSPVRIISSPNRKHSQTRDGSGSRQSFINSRRSKSPGKASFHNSMINNSQLMVTN